ncbi:hypothetical protein GUJ93_ZPchr0001g29400 [Zizania palustris]|uniref:Uncharacterized protein n=1 Tax=Zizania palustris TaxID=103762 RepID=A0A8J5S0L8_ZIZPA|nr:hypothetical protein GUJ93_ZPchr0001g29400 [Zizania palustris]
MHPGVFAWCFLADAAASSRREMSQQAMPPKCCSLLLASNGALREKTTPTAAAVWESLVGPKPWLKKLLRQIAVPPVQRKRAAASDRCAP